MHCCTRLWYACLPSSLRHGPFWRLFKSLGQQGNRDEKRGWVGGIHWQMTRRTPRKCLTQMNTAIYRFIFWMPSVTRKATKTFDRSPPPPLGKRKKEWLIKIEHDKGPHFKAGNGADCGKNNHPFVLMTSLNCQCTSHRHFWPCTRSDLSHLEWSISDCCEQYVNKPDKEAACYVHCLSRD